MAKVAEILEIHAAITERGQTTVPAAIRRMLALEKRDHVVFRGLADGTVVIARRPEPGDPVLGRFLSLLAGDMAANPDRIQAVTAKRLSRAVVLVEGVDVDLDEALSDDAP